ncbi:hypothetical protein CCHR01_19989 [Colletotrichum chrysophilum]|uniref:Uncharacterized protein n=1 Tax=Colletotrichum chrysophilum TaxID=1836956 RepID=A0AAD9E6R2_9PEZI|nr:hypothetical protein CCHR01_19989 [Colletotrichum chrysophilum]
MTQLQQQIKACRQEEDTACERQTEIEKAYEAAVQHRRKVSAFPNTQNMVSHTGVTFLIREAHPSQKPSTRTYATYIHT